jgi:hypothetical protein
LAKVAQADRIARLSCSIDNQVGEIEPSGLPGAIADDEAGFHRFIPKTLSGLDAALARVTFSACQRPKPQRQVAASAYIFTQYIKISAAIDRYTAYCTSMWPA